MKTLPFCPRCRSKRVTDGSSLFITVLGIVIFVLGQILLFALTAPIQITEWANFYPLEGHDCRAFCLIILGIVLFIGGSRHPTSLYCEACGHKWEHITVMPKSARLH